MENLGLWIYLASIADGIETIAILIATGSCAILLTFGIAREIADISPKDKVILGRWLKRMILPFVISFLIIVFAPSTKTCYQIIGITAATELYQNSDALQQLPEKSIEALNRLLDSIAAEDCGE